MTLKSTTAKATLRTPSTKLSTVMMTKMMMSMTMGTAMTTLRISGNAYFVNHTIKAGMLDGYTGMRGGKTVNPQTGKKPPIAATPFARKQKKVVAKVRLFASNFPGITDYKDMPSGKGLKDVKIDFIVKVWKADKIANNKGGDVSTNIKLHDFKLVTL
jgi:hypothetical protein